MGVPAFPRLGGRWGAPHTHSLSPALPAADCSITKFLNRILGLEVHKQNTLFQYFSDTFDHLIEVDKKEGKYDMGILGERPRRAVHVGSAGGGPLHRAGGRAGSAGEPSTALPGALLRRTPRTAPQSSNGGAR